LNPYNAQSRHILQLPANSLPCSAFWTKICRSSTPLTFSLWIGIWHGGPALIAAWRCSKEVRITIRCHMHMVQTICQCLCGDATYHTYHMRLKSVQNNVPQNRPDESSRAQPGNTEGTTTWGHFISRALMKIRAGSETTHLWGAGVSRTIRDTPWLWPKHTQYPPKTLRCLRKHTRISLRVPTSETHQ
jgi:hypothetical protein